MVNRVVNKHKKFDRPSSEQASLHVFFSLEGSYKDILKIQFADKLVPLHNNHNILR